jgi:formylglycine-generating enzyme required for sulfatase activity
MGLNPSRFKGVNLPVEQVSWEDCQEFLQKLNAKVVQQLDGKIAGLPTEAEWEYCSRAGSSAKWCFGDDERTLGDYAWVRANSEKRTHPVGQKKPNAWGLYDMHGNVWEWCQDWYAVTYSSGAVTDPTGPGSGDARCLRGGGWVGGGNSRSAGRGWIDPQGCSNGIGMRTALHAAGIASK